MEALMLLADAERAHDAEKDFSTAANAAAVQRPFLCERLIASGHGQRDGPIT